MKLSFRWYGEDDPVTLSYIRQIPNMNTIVSAVYSVPAGAKWPEADVMDVKSKIETAGLKFDVVESVPVHEDIKLGKPSRDIYIENYIHNIRLLGKAGVKVICYNFMPVFDWTRTQLQKQNPDGSNALAYYAEDLASMDPLTGSLSLPGWDSSYTKETLREVFSAYEKLSEEDLWNNLQYFLEAIIPEAKTAGIQMAIHQDDPPWNIFGLPRIITCEKNLDRMLHMVDEEANGLTLCTGSLGVSAQNNMVYLADKYTAMGRIHFMHMRNVKLLKNGFEETAHPSNYGSLDMVSIMQSLHKNKYTGYIRPDHGRMIWGETGRPGYGLYDRALGATYLYGIWETLTKLS